MLKLITETIKQKQTHNRSIIVDEVGTKVIRKKDLGSFEDQLFMHFATTEWDWETGHCSHHAGTLYQQIINLCSD